MLVKEIFRSLQGEGPNVGTPAVFIRLAGCNLSCPWCDTDHTTDAKRMSEAEIVSQVDLLLPPNKFVVVTGGEPLLQPLEELIDRLMEIHTQVQIETNGILWQEALAKDRPHAECISVVCSPKLGHPIHERIWWRTDAFKVVYGDGDSDSLPVLYDGRLFIQPRDDQDPEKNKANLQACIDLCFREGHRLSLQTHKLIGVP